MNYVPAIGLEVHVQLATRTKIFCSCSTDYSGEPPNTHVCPVCLGLPGSLPVLNERVLDMAVRTVRALGGEVARESKFDRKNYFYPDLPKAYQISQYDKPIGLGGGLTIERPGGGSHWVRLIRVHMEEDAGKLIHPGGGQASLVDYNRAGVPLLEIVAEPDIDSPEDARRYLQKLRSILLYIEASDCNMEEGSLRCDANVSIRPEGRSELGTRTEIKNLNSFRSVVRALEYEIARQTEVVESGEDVVQETRLWDEQRSVTATMRGKEEAHDYRYFPEPDLPLLRLSGQEIQRIAKELPELPDARSQRLKAQYGLGGYDAGVLTSERALADYFEAAVAVHPNAKALSNWIQSELLGALNKEGKSIQECPVSPVDLAGLVELIDQGTISGKIAKKVFSEMYERGVDAPSVVQEKGLSQIQDEGLLEKVVQEVLKAHPVVAESIRAGKGKAIGFLVGKVMQKTRGKANPQMVQDLLRRKI